MMGKVKQHVDYSEWHPWFAWHPVYVYWEIVKGEVGQGRWVWWENIERRFQGGYDGYVKYYRLRLP